MAECEELLNEFLERFPLESLKNISIDDYVLNGNENSFSRWLEFKTKTIGNISGGTAFNHGIYKKATSVDTTKSQYSQDDVYAWFSKYGKTSSEAFEKVRTIVYEIAKAATDGNYKKVDEIEFSQSAKMKIAFMYSNKKMINIFKSDAIDYLAKMYNLQQNIGLAEKSHELALLVDKNDFWNSRLWEEWTNSDEYKKQQPKSFWVCGFNFGGDNSQYDRFIKESIWIGGFDERKDKKQIEDCKKVKPGDSIILKTSYTTGENHSISTIKVFAIGIVKSIREEEKYEEGRVGFTFDVDYTTIEPNKEFKNCSYRKTIEQIRNENNELRKFINDFLGIQGETMENTNKIDEYVQLLKSNHNIILHGAPGTGKTHLANEIANAMGAEVERVQFHPSYDYTDFVEGLRPDPETSINGQIGFERKDGVFKEFCGKALKNLIESQKKPEERQQEKSIEEQLNYFLTEAVENDTQFELLGRKTKFNIKDFNEKKVYIVADNKIAKDIEIKISDIIAVLSSKENLTKAGDVAKFFNHPNYGYQSDSYVYALYTKLKSISIIVESKVVENDIERKNFIFIIDEINRGEISKIFGELFFSIDPGYRGERGAVKTQYQNLVEEGDVFKEGFFVPENVYIIGTMNDIDRSVESMDFAMRRRFIFKEITAKESAENMNLGDEAKRRMTALNDAISKIDGLGSSYHIGAAYFLKNGEPISTDEDFDELWNLRLESLLKEYLRGTGNEDDIKKLRNAFFSLPDDDNKTEDGK